MSSGDNVREMSALARSMARPRSSIVVMVACSPLAPTADLTAVANCWAIAVVVDGSLTPPEMTTMERMVLQILSGENVKVRGIAVGREVRMGRRVAGDMVRAALLELLAQHRHHIAPQPLNLV